jgi:hypothetical protein
MSENGSKNLDEIVVRFDEITEMINNTGDTY